MPQKMFVVELGHKGVDLCQNPTCGFVGSASCAGRDRQGGTTPSGFTPVRRLCPCLHSAYCIGFMFVEVQRSAHSFCCWGYECAWISWTCWATLWRKAVGVCVAVFSSRGRGRRARRSPTGTQIGDRLQMGGAFSTKCGF